MAVFTYVAKDRGTLMDGHSAETEYSIEIPLTKWSPATKKEQTINRSLSNIRYGTLRHIKRYYAFAVLATEEQLVIDQFIELFDSVANNETFQVDPYGSIAVPNSPIDVTMDGDFSQPREEQTYFGFSGRVELI